MLLSDVDQVDFESGGCDMRGVVCAEASFGDHAADDAQILLNHDLSGKQWHRRHKYADRGHLDIV